MGVFRLLGDRFDNYSIMLIDLVIIYIHRLIV